MILTIDIGNSNIVFSAFDEDKIIFSSHMASQIEIMDDQYAIQFLGALNFYNVDKNSINGAIISSVVPQITEKIKSAVSKLIIGKIMIVSPGLKTGLNIKIDSPSELGADFVCSSVFAKANYPLPLIVIDMDTATKISVLDNDGNFIGGSIIPGIRIATDALSKNTAQLPFVSLDKPSSIIGKNTVDCMKSGIIYGTAAMLDGMIKRYSHKLATENLTAILTGVNAKIIMDFCEYKMIYDENIITKGLKIIYDKNN